jgi:hypothetical protein
VIVRPLAADETAPFRALRLRALAEAPDAFARTHAEISTKPAAWWEEMTGSLTEPGRNVMFVAEESSAPIGTAFGIVDRQLGPASGDTSS